MHDNSRSLKILFETTWNQILELCLDCLLWVEGNWSKKELILTLYDPESIHKCQKNLFLHDVDKVQQKANKKEELNCKTIQMVCSMHTVAVHLREKACIRTHFGFNNLIISFASPKISLLWILRTSPLLHSSTNKRDQLALQHIAKSLEIVQTFVFIRRRIGSESNRNTKNQSQIVWSP